MYEERIKSLEKRIEEEEEVMMQLFEIDIGKMDYQQLSNIITRCNWTISLRLKLKELKKS